MFPMPNLGNIGELFLIQNLKTGIYYIVGVYPSHGYFYVFQKKRGFYLVHKSSKHKTNVCESYKGKYA